MGFRVNIGFRQQPVKMRPYFFRGMSDQRTSSTTTSCGHFVLDTQREFPYSASHKKRVLINQLNPVEMAGIGFNKDVEDEMELCTKMTDVASLKVLTINHINKNAAGVVEQHNSYLYHQTGCGTYIRKNQQHILLANNID